MAPEPVTQDFFEPGDRVLLIDTRGRRYLITLRTAGEFHFHRGIVSHDQILGSKEGSVVISTGNERLIALRPTISEFILKMPRGAQVVYPKDAAMMILLADIYPGACVLEAGAGSGGLTIALLRAVGQSGRVVTYEVREDFASNARSNVEAFLGKTENLDIRMGSVYEPIEKDNFDRAVLDLPEPWRAIPHVAETMRSGGILASYLPSIVQVQRLTESLRTDERWAVVSTSETLIRTWHVEDQAVRPDHRMIGHTGFITTARLVGKGN